MILGGCFTGASGPVALCSETHARLIESEIHTVNEFPAGFQFEPLGHHPSPASEPPILRQRNDKRPCAETLLVGMLSEDDADHIFLRVGLEEPEHELIDKFRLEDVAFALEEVALICRQQILDPTDPFIRLNTGYPMSLFHSCFT